MRVISTNVELSKQLKRLIKKYPRIAIATAWASADTGVFNALVQHDPDGHFKLLHLWTPKVLQAERRKL